MAFVCQSKRQLTNINNKHLAGPGSYQLSNRPEIMRDNYAPFCSTVTRRTYEGKDSLPGPGYYQLGQNVGEATVTTYMHKNSIVIKVNSEGTMPFMSRIQRFQSESTSPQPGPGSYIKMDREAKVKKFFPRRKKVASLPKADNSTAIKTKKLHEKRIKTEEAIRSIKESMRNTNPKKSAGIWSKDKIERFKSEPKYVQVGPGKYNLEQRPRIMTRPGTHSVSFASKTVKSFLDTVMYQTRNTITLKDRAEKAYKDTLPGPGSYDTKNEPYMDTEKYKNHSFGSTIQRFQAKEPQNDVPFYVFSEKKDRYKGRAVFASETKRCLTVGSSIEEQPGPGYYEPTREHIGKILKVEIGSFGSKSKRKTIELNGDSQVGPGTYNSQYKHEHVQQPKTTSNFTSSVPRFSHNIKDYNFGTYDIYKDDLSRKVLTTKLHRQNLEKIECIKPPFQSQIPRFEHYQTFKQPTSKATLKEKQIAILAAQYKKRVKSIQQARAQVPKNSTLSKVARFEKEKQGPGVGDYPLRDRWLKKSFNTKYKKD